jgi:RNA polymerase sigma factor (sigma-70 family)
VPGPDAEAAAERARAALALLASRGPAFRRTASRYSLCWTDADDAYARAVEILLTKGPATDAEHLARWMQVVTRREALALRRARERLLGGSAEGAEAALAAAPCHRADPVERAELRERLRRAASALRRLKANERRALLLKAQGYSYAEIAALTGWSYTKVNRALTEGRARLRSLPRP